MKLSQVPECFGTGPAPKELWGGICDACRSEVRIECKAVWSENRIAELESHNLACEEQINEATDFNHRLVGLILRLTGTPEEEIAGLEDDHALVVLENTLKLWASHKRNDHMNRAFPQYGFAAPQPSAASMEVLTSMRTINDAMNAMAKATQNIVNISLEGVNKTRRSEFSTPADVMDYISTLENVIEILQGDLSAIQDRIRSGLGSCMHCGELVHGDDRSHWKTCTAHPAAPLLLAALNLLNLPWEETEKLFITIEADNPHDGEVLAGRVMDAMQKLQDALENCLPGWENPGKRMAQAEAA